MLKFVPKTKPSGVESGSDMPDGATGIISEMERKAGYYKVRFKNVWTVGLFETECLNTWFLVGTSEHFTDKDFEVIGPRINFDMEIEEWGGETAE